MKDYLLATFKNVRFLKSLYFGTFHWFRGNIPIYFSVRKQPPRGVLKISSIFAEEHP